MLSRRLAAVVCTLITYPAMASDLEPVRKPRQHKTAPPLAPLLKQVRAFIRVAPVREAPYRLTGEGQTVAILDTGIRATHVDFGRGARVVAQRNFTADNGGKADDATDGNGHGTNVAGIIAAGGINEGVANNARIVAVKVLSNVGGGSDEAIERGLKWVIDNRTALGITAVNMSLSWRNNPQDDGEPTNAEVAKAIRVLRANGVAVVASAGNHYHRFKKQGMAFPAIVRESVSVGAVYDNEGGEATYASGAKANSRRPGQITPFSQRLHSTTASHTFTDILAPGAPVTSTGIDNDETAFSTQDGTSQAAPVVTGLILLMQEYLARHGKPAATVDELEKWLRAGGRDEKDGDNEDDNVPHTNLLYRRVDALGAMEAMARDRGLPVAGGPGSDAALAAVPSPKPSGAEAVAADATCRKVDKTALNLDWSATDVNGFPRNPWWAIQNISGDEIDPVCHCGGFPLKSKNANHVVAHGDPQCTDQTVLDLPRKVHAFTCKLEWVLDPRFGVVRGHVNWFPVVVTGHAYYDHQSGPDNDVNIELVPDTTAPNGRVPGQTRWNREAGDLKRSDSLHVEMKKKETLTFLSQNWWRELADANKKAAQAKIDGLRAVVVGLFGVDAEHKGHSELHPAYALAFRTACSTTGDRVAETWAIFARNYGNEGWCSRWDEWHQLVLNNKALTLQLPLDGNAKSIAIPSATLFSNPGISATYALASKSGTTADLQLAWPRASDAQEVRVHGEVSLAWQPVNGAPRCAPPVPGPSVEATADPADDSGELFLEDLTARAAAGAPAAEAAAPTDAKAVPAAAVHMATVARTGPCPHSVSGCTEALRARTPDAFFAVSPATAESEAATAAAIDEKLCEVALAMVPDYRREAAGKNIESPEGMRLRQLESFLAMCEVAGEDGR